MVAMELDPTIAKTFIKYARLVAARGYIHNTLGNIVIRVPHPDYPHGVAYTKHAELSLEEMEGENIVITDIPTSKILFGDKVTSIGHNLSREILRLRPDIQVSSPSTRTTAPAVTSPGSRPAMSPTTPPMAAPITSATRAVTHHRRRAMPGSARVSGTRCWSVTAPAVPATGRRPARRPRAGTGC